MLTIKARDLIPGDTFRKPLGTLEYIVIDTSNWQNKNPNKIYGVNYRGKTCGVHKNKEVCLVRKSPNKTKTELNLCTMQLTVEDRIASAIFDAVENEPSADELLSHTCRETLHDILDRSLEKVKDRYPQKTLDELIDDIIDNVEDAYESALSLEKKNLRNYGFDPNDQSIHDSITRRLIRRLSDD